MKSRITLEGNWPSSRPGTGTSNLINCEVNSLGSLCSQLMLETTLTKQVAFGRSAWAGGENQSVTEAERARLSKWLDIAELVSTDFEWKAVSDRISRFRKRLKDPHFNVNELYIEVRTLKEAVDDGLREQHIYRYPTKKAAILVNWKTDWSAVLASFPSARDDILASVDLWALSHSTASIFHSMRILEIGLRALAKDVQKPFDVQNWQNIINEIEAAIRAQERELPRGAEKSERLQFLSEAAKEFSYFKDGWRNHVSHNKCAYDEHQAQSVMEHVRQFMTALSRHLSEQD